MNDLPNRIISISRTFADGTPLFSKVHDTDIFPKELNSDLRKFENAFFNGKYNLILIPITKKNEAIFCRKLSNCSHPPVTFNNNVTISLLETFGHCFRFKTRL